MITGLVTELKSFDIGRGAEGLFGFFQKRPEIASPP